MELSSDPGSDDIVLVLTDDNNDDYALVWNGASWSNQVLLNTVNSQSVTDVSVTWEQQSGRAMVVYAKDQVNVHYRTWNGSSWSVEGTVTAPVGPSGKARWTTLASDPNSNRIGLGVLTEDQDAWFAVWDGATWNASDKLSATLDTNDRGYPNIAIAFESQSGELLTTYGIEDTFIRYRTWTTGSGWSGELTGPDLTEKPTSMTLDSDPKSNRIMLSVLDENKDVNYVLWDGTAWGTPAEQEVDTGQSDAQPFVFIWDNDPNNAPVLTDTTVSLANVTEDTGPPMGVVGTLLSALADLNLPTGGQDNVTDVDNDPVTGVAITAAETTNGTWHYSINGGTNWNQLGAVSNASARVLAADASTRIYFQANPDYNGTIANALTFRAWDQTDAKANGIATNGDSLTWSVQSNSNAGLVTASVGGNTLTLDYLAEQNGRVHHHRTRHRCGHTRSVDRRRLHCDRGRGQRCTDSHTDSGRHQPERRRRHLRRDCRGHNRGQRR